MSGKTKPLIAILAAAETSPSVLYGLYDVLYSVGSVWPDMTMGEPREDALDVRIVAADAAAFRCAGNVVVEPHAAIDAIDRPDVVILCDMYTPVTQPPSGKYPREMAWLRKVHDAGALICSVCSGSLVLAEAGLLDGREAAAHWAYDDLFRRCYPRVTMRAGDVLCLSSASDGIVTAGAVTAWQDLALWLIARLCGPRQALETAKVFLLASHDDGQLPYAAMGRRIDGSDAVIAECQGWIAENYHVDNPVRHMTERSGLNPRTFARRFRAATGYQPIDYVQALRIEEAKQMLEVSEEGLDEIAATVGYEDPASFRRLFKRKAGLTPAAYRRKFRGIADLGRAAQ
ncbi:MAG TPA: helix-turn-helix domain-containing protein [Thermohalobaculum sp.]|nr:helix-turn-helix domain-containing protein [Thermohalobaculum sp.]